MTFEEMQANKKNHIKNQMVKRLDKHGPKLKEHQLLKNTIAKIEFEDKGKK